MLRKPILFFISLLFLFNILSCIKPVQNTATPSPDTPTQEEPTPKPEEPTPTPDPEPSTPSSFFGLTDYDNKHTDGTYNESDFLRNGTVYTYTAKDISGDELQQKAKALKTGDTIIFDGSEGIFYFSATAKFTTSGITLKGINNAILDFKELHYKGLNCNYTQEYIDAAIEKVKAGESAGGSRYLSEYDSELNKHLNRGYGIRIQGDHILIEDLTIQNASSNGILFYTGGDYNVLKNVETRYCGDSGIQLTGQWIDPIDCPEEHATNGPHDNKFFNCYSHDNFDPWNLGENADGFAIKGAGDYNYFEDCIAEYNSDDGWDCFRIRGSSTLVNCKANYNGIRSPAFASEPEQIWGKHSNGNGFKLGGGSTSAEFNGQIVNSASIHRHPQYLKDCTAIGNRGNSGVGFDRNNQYGSIYLVDCFASDNKANILGSNGKFRHTDFEFGDYGNICYVLRCFVGNESDKVHGKYEGDKIVVQ